MHPCMAIEDVFACSEAKHAWPRRVAFKGKKMGPEGGQSIDPGKRSKARKDTERVHNKVWQMQ